MEQFAKSWLELREPFDHAARNPELLADLVRWSDQHSHLIIVDLGAGTGSNYRALRDHIACSFRFKAVDHDPALLRTLENEPVETRVADLARDLEAVCADADLIVCSALLDLVSEAWLVRLAALQKPLYAVLSVNGMIDFEPALPMDHKITADFERHQCRDKGFGPAMGTNAAGRLQNLLGISARSAPSDWLLGREDRAIQHQLIDGMASAASEIDPDSALSAWHKTRADLINAGLSQIRIGHSDLLWLPATA